MYTAKVIIITTTTTAAIHSITTVTGTPMATDCFHPAALVLDGDMNRSHVLVVCVRVGVAVRVSGEVGSAAAMVLTGEVCSA